MKKLNWIFTSAFLIMLFFVGCNPDNEICYDQEMEENHSGICQRDCPEVCGCDGKTYCNECTANSKGISIVHLGPCN